MPSPTGQPITFIVAGRPEPTADGLRGGTTAPLPGALTRGRLKHSIRVDTGRGSRGEARIVAVPGEDVVVLHIAGGPELVLHPETARDLLVAQSGLARGPSGRDAAGPDEVRIPPRLQWRGLEQGLVGRGATRGWLGDVLVSAVDVITDLAVDGAADATAAAIVARVDREVDPGVYALAPDSLPALKGSGALRTRIPAAPNGAPLLVLVHGTFTDTSGTFSKLWTHHPHLVRALFTHYRDQVYALDHPTLGASPIANALTLARALPARARLHLATHSRGGLVAEVLARASAQPDADDAVFAGSAFHADRQDLRTLLALVKRKGIQVDRIVRVACPARGTLLASRRLDAYLSVFKWTLELAGVPVAPTLVDFLAAVAKRRSDPERFPGLAAQIPDSPLIRWLHASKDPIGGQLRVIAGDIEGDSVASWLKTLLTDAFYWTDHDLVVQTRSMYGGVPRQDGARFLFDRGAQVSHFGYFGNERTAHAIVDALTEDAPHGFRSVGAQSWAGESSTGARGRRVARPGRRPPHELPALFLLPEMNEGLSDFLSKTHEIITFAFDWRLPMEDEARRLGDAVELALDARTGTRQPVRVIAHSIGGLIARAMQLERPETWKRMLAHHDARLLMLGTPNGGTWAPMRMLSGDDPFGNALGAAAQPFLDHRVRQDLAQCPGLMQLQAGLLDASLGLADHATWRRLATEDLDRISQHRWWHNAAIQLDACRWGVPEQQVLDRAVRLRKRLDAQRDSDLERFADRLALVMGRAHSTPDGFERGAEGLVYLDAVDAGDGRVTHESAQLPAVRAWVLDCAHDELPRRPDGFGAYLELLQTGTTMLLAPFETTRAGAPATRARSRLSRTRSSSQPPGAVNLYTVDARSPDEPSAATGAALRITVVNGDLSFVSRPLLIGHYRSMRLTGTERVMDRLIGGAMEDSLRANLYPDRPGTHQVFVNLQVDPTNPWHLPRPEAVVVAGLGDEGALQSADLVHTVRQAVLAWSQRLAERPDGAAAVFELTATLIGSGGSRITVGQSAQLVAQGVREANRRLDDERLAERPWPRVSHLHLIELYLDRAGEAWRALRMQALASPGEYLVSEAVETGTGPLPRPIDSGYRGADYDLITATTERGRGGEAVIAYTLDTRRARTEVRAQATQAALLRTLIAKASNDRNRDTQIGRTLFQLLVPIEMEPFLGGTTEMVIELDSGTAGIPWELLDTTTGAGRDDRPWAIRTKLLRKLRTPDFRPQVVDAGADSSVLVVGEPACDAAYPRLAGARAEARQVAERLIAPGALAGDRVTSLISPDDPDAFGADAPTILNALLERNWRIVHIAGHGEPPEADGDPRGVVLSDHTFLGPREIRGMRAVPELVFVNCCHLAARSTAQALGGPHDRARFAAGVAEELIKIGVRCVIAAGWAVEDGPACAFATAFYDALLGGRRFIDAVAEARETAASFGGNTWAAYQCYGDPDWTFRLTGSDAQRPHTPLVDEFAGIASSRGLTMALQTLAVRSRFQGARAADQQARIRHLQARFASRWGGIGAVAEAFGAAWSEAGDSASAASWYERAIAANDGTASIKSTEQLGNIRARLAWDNVDRARRRLADLRRAPAGAGRGQRPATRKTGAPRATTAREVAAAGRALDAAIVQARKTIRDAISLLETTVAMEATMERETLCGSAYKRLALIEADSRRTREERQALQMMKQHYARAEQLGRDGRLSDVFYPALNRIAAELVMEAGRPEWRGLDPRAVAAVRQSLASKVRDDPDFWSVAGQAELSMFEAVGRGTLAKKRASIEADYADLHVRVSAPWMWASIRDQAQFVLVKYATRAPTAEQNAARALLERITAFAASPASGAHEG
jgi:CHAT domain-containing protein